MYISKLIRVAIIGGSYVDVSKEGETMYVENALHFWKKNWIKAISIMITVALGIAAILVAALLSRSQVVTQLEETLVNGGNFDFAIYEASDEIVQKIKDDKRIEKVGMVYELGTISNEDGMEYTVGSMGDGDTVDMVHLLPVTGRYPKKDGEITMDKLAMQSMGLKPETGVKIKLKIKKRKGEVIEEKTYTVVGIIEQQYVGNSGQLDMRRKYETEDMDDQVTTVINCPCAYIFDGERKKFKEEERTHLFVNVKQSTQYDDQTLKEELMQQYGDTIYLDYNKEGRSHYADAILGYKQQEDGSIDTANGYLDATERIGSDSTQKDFLSGVLIPVFACLIAIMTFFSLYQVFGKLIFERKTELGMYRCLGLKRSGMVFLIVAEWTMVIIPGILLGIGLGQAVYHLILYVENHVFDMGLQSVYEMQEYFAPFIKSATPDPYMCALVFVGLAIVITGILHIPVIMRLSPMEACKNKAQLKGVSKKFTFIFAINMIILFAAITVGFLYFQLDARQENEVLLEEANGCLYDGADYMMEKNQSLSVKHSIGTELRHDAGVSEENLETLKGMDSVQKVHALVQCRNTNLLLSNNKTNEELQDFMEENQIVSGYEDDKTLFRRWERDLTSKGYDLQKEALCQLPTTAMEWSELKNMSDCIQSGELHQEAIEDGKEVVLVYSENKPPLEVGENITLSVSVYPEKDDYSSEYFSYGYIGEDDQEPDYVDKYGKQYCLGERKDIHVTIGAIVKLEDYEDVGFYIADNPLNVAVFTSVEGLHQWQVPDKNYTKVAVKLKEKTDTDEFETVWYRLLQKGKIMQMQSLEKLKEELVYHTKTNRAIFGAMASMLVFVNVLGIVNVLSMQVLEENKRNSILRALGASNRRMKGKLLKKQIGVLLTGAFAAFGTIIFIYKIREWIDIKTERYLNGEIELPLNWWGYDFPFVGIERASCLVVFVIAVVMLLLIGVIVVLVYDTKNRKVSIAEGMREE